MTYDEFKLQGLEEFAEFSYFKGEADCPYQTQTPEFTWWNFEKNYYDNYKKSGKWKTFSEFLDFWIKEIAAPGSGYDLSEGNWWKKEYEENKPYLINISIESDFTMYKYFKGEANTLLIMKNRILFIISGGMSLYLRMNSRKRKASNGLLSFVIMV